MWESCTDHVCDWIALQMRVICMHYYRDSLEWQEYAEVQTSDIVHLSTQVHPMRDELCVQGMATRYSAQFP
jgi:hypothetical protein